MTRNFVSLLIPPALLAGLLAAPNATLQDILPTESGAPMRIVIPRFGIDAPVRPGQYDAGTQTWSIASDAAQYVATTALPNIVAGKTVIYAHNTAKLFGPLVHAKLSVGDTVVITTGAGSVLIYAYTGQEDVSPTDTDVFKAAAVGQPQLVLLTCDGLWNQKRLLLHFALTS